MALPIRTRPSFPLSQSLPSGSFHSFLSFSIRERRQTENHSHRKLTNLVTWTTALSDSAKLWAMPCRATQDGQVMVESSDKIWSTGEGNGKPRQYSCLEKPMNSILTIQSSNHAVWYSTCQWQIGTCQGHLPSASVEIESLLLQLLILIRPEGNSGWRMRHSVLQENWWNRSLGG